MKGIQHSRKIAVAIMLIALMLLLLLPLNLIPKAKASETVVYSNGFESNDGGYIHTGSPDEWQWGTPTNPSGTTAHSGTKCWATDLTSDPPDGTSCYLTSPAITLPSITATQRLRVNFWAWINVYFMSPRGDFYVSSDNSTWVTVAELLGTMNGNWSNYDFDVSNYAGGQIYLRFALLYNEYSSYPGFYLDDVKITQYDVPAQNTTLTITAEENPGAGASCPWVFSRTASGFVQDNDIYSTAQSQSEEYTDYYTLNDQPIQVNGQYQLNLQELTQETSYTDFVQLLAVDHSAGTKIASDENGNILTYSNPVAPISATDEKGNDVLNQIATQDGSGVKVYNGDTVTLNFSNVDTSKGATLVLTAQGFLDDGNTGTSTGTPPRIFVQTQDTQGNWITRNSFYPRNNFATAAYDLSQFLGSNKQVRLYATSCLTGKYHLIDYVGLDNNPQASTVINKLSPITAVHSVNGDVLSKLINADGKYASMSPGETISLSFAAPVSQGEVRDFILVTKGYYIPAGTFFVETWDGSSWVERDGWSVPRGSSDVDYTHTFDLSLFLPDPNGNFNVRIWQDYIYESASINYVGLTYAGVAGNLTGAYDLKKGEDVTLALNQTDDLRDVWAGAYNGPRDRLVEANFTVQGYNIVLPVITKVTVSNTQSANPTISWTYYDANALPQAAYQVEVWEGPGGTGSILWNPSAGSGTTNSVVYAGTALNTNQTYYVQVKASDGTNWGFWNETSFTTPIQFGTPSPSPTATTHPLTASATTSSGTSVTVAAGNSLKITGTVSGGTSPYKLQWVVYVSPNSTVNGWLNGQTSTTLTASQTVPGTYLYYLLVIDAGGQVAVTNKVTLTVTQSSSSPTSTPTLTATPTPTVTPPVNGAITSTDLYMLVIAIIIIIVVLILAALLLYKRRRNLTVTVQDTRTLSPISGASVSASGPKSLSGTTGSNGQIVFENVKAGDYEIKASATGYNPSTPVSVSVTTKTNHVIKLDSTAS